MAVTMSSTPPEPVPLQSDHDVVRARHHRPPAGRRRRAAPDRPDQARHRRVRAGPQHGHPRRRRRDDRGALRGQRTRRRLGAVRGLRAGHRRRRPGAGARASAPATASGSGCPAPAGSSTSSRSRPRRARARRSGWRGGADASGPARGRRGQPGRAGAPRGGGDGLRPRPRRAPSAGRRRSSPPSSRPTWCVTAAAARWSCAPRPTAGSRSSPGTAARGSPISRARVRDGFSTAGGPGNGLGAVRRLSAGFDVYTAPGDGTVVLARMRRAPIGGPRRSVDGLALAHGGRGGQRRRLEPRARRDLRHGPARRRARARPRGRRGRAATRGPASSPRTRPRRRCSSAMHGALRPTRGAAAAVARSTRGPAPALRRRRQHRGDDRRRAAGRRSLASMNGTLGHRVDADPRLRASARPRRAAGHALRRLPHRLGPARHPGLARRDPLVIAGAADPRLTSAAATTSASSSPDAAGTHERRAADRGRARATSEDVVLARQRAREVAELLGFDRQDQTRIATAVSELARNAHRYAGGGRVVFLRAGRRAARSRWPTTARASRTSTRS